MTGPDVSGTGVLIDRSGDDPKWIIATVTLPADVRSAEIEPGGWRYADWPAVTEWVRARIGQRARLVPVSATVWHLDQEAAEQRLPGQW